MDHVDTCVIGAGVVGLAIAKKLAPLAPELLVVDSEQHYGQGISSRNSEVVHAGIYYAKNSLKAQLCVQGNKLLTDYCRERHVAFEQCGKLIVATAADEEPVLDEILAKAIANDVNDLAYWSADKIQQKEPQIQAKSALFSPSTGIVSAHELMNSYLTDVEMAGGSFVGGTQVVAVNIEDHRFVVECLIDGASYVFSTRTLINSAGLGAQLIAASVNGLNMDSVPALHLCKGSYFTLTSGNPFSHLIYPVPEKSGAGLGVHATIDLGGQVKFGPDVEYIEELDYSVSSEKLPLYYEAVRRYFPGLKDESLAPGYVGIRPKLQGPGEPVADFVIQGEDVHGIPRLVQLFGIESPGLTSSLAIADYVYQLLAVRD